MKENIDMIAKIREEFKALLYDQNQEIEALKTRCNQRLKDIRDAMIRPILEEFDRVLIGQRYRSKNAPSRILEVLDYNTSLDPFIDDESGEYHIVFMVWLQYKDRNIRCAKSSLDILLDYELITNPSPLEKEAGGLTTKIK